MLFCGQCGFKLNSGDTQCPRCGAPIEPGAPIEDDAQPDAPTVTSPSLHGHIQPQAPVNSNNAGEPQKLILRPDSDAGTSNYGTQAAYDATRRMELPEQRYGATPGAPPPGIVPSRPADAQTPYSPPGGNYPPSGIYTEYPQSGSNYVPQGLPYPRPPQQGYQPYTNQDRRTSTNDRGRTAALLIILLGLLLLLVAITLFILERNNVFGSTNSGNSSAVTYLEPQSLYSTQPSSQRFV